MPLSDTKKLAAIDIDSNSIHLVIAERFGEQLRRVASMSEKVQLAMGLDEQNQLSAAVIQRGLECLQRFSERLGDGQLHLRVVATSTLRRAINSQEFIAPANQILPVPVEIISGREEARLIYLGVAQTCPSPRQRFVVDIGGGSTKLIVGKQFNPILTESAQIGVVGFTQQFFPNGVIDGIAFEKAIYAAQKQIIKYTTGYKQVGFDEAIGSSSAIKAIWQAIAHFGLGESITIAGVEQLKASLVGCGHIDNFEMAGVSRHQKPFFVAGVAILLAVMKAFGVRLLHYCDGALREGVMYDMLSRINCYDVRDESVATLISRFGVDKKHGKRIAKTASVFFTQAYRLLDLPSDSRQILRWAALLHEVGIVIGRSGYHKHSSYLLKYADMAGFSRTEQEKLSLLVRYHRGAINQSDYDRMVKIGGRNLAWLALLLRLSVVANFGRFELSKQQLKLTINNACWHIFVKIDRPEYQACVIDIQDEASWFEKWGVCLTVSGG